MADPLTKNAVLGAASIGNLDVLRRAHEEGFDFFANAVPLRWASARGFVNCVRFLIPLSDVRASDSAPLRAAASNGHEECVEALLPYSDVGVAVSSLLAEGEQDVASFLSEFALRKRHSDIAPRHRKGTL